MYDKKFFKGKGIQCFKNTWIKNQRSHEYLLAKRRKYAKFQTNSMKDVRRVVKTSFVNGNCKNQKNLNDSVKNGWNIVQMHMKLFIQYQGNLQIFKRILQNMKQTDPSLHWPHMTQRHIFPWHSIAVLRENGSYCTCSQWKSGSACWSENNRRPWSDCIACTDFIYCQGQFHILFGQQKPYQEWVKCTRMLWWLTFI